MVNIRRSHDHIMEPTTVGSLWLENELHENELEFESYVGRSKKNVRVTSDGIHAEIHEIWTCVAPAAPPLFHAAVNPCLQGESPWNWSCNSVNLRKSTVTWMRWHYVFTVISRWSTFSSTVNVCNINCVIFSDTHCSFAGFGPPILWHSPFLARARPAVPLGLWSITSSLRGNFYVPRLHKFIKWFADNDVAHRN